MPTTRARKKSNRDAERPLPNRIRVRVQYAVSRRGVPAAESLRKWAALVPIKATLRIVGAAEGTRLNRQYRKKPYATNVLSFPYEKGRGDVVLCHPVIAREARRQGKTLAAHYAHLVLHGLLHLRGYEHEKKREAERMERLEIRLLARAGFGNPYTVE
jgi:probable rRNA maturation factor